MYVFCYTETQKFYARSGILCLKKLLDVCGVAYDNVMIVISVTMKPW